MAADFNNLVEFSRFWSERQGEKILYRFLEDGESVESTMSFAQNDLAARALAARLQDLGLEGKRAILLYPPGLDYITGFFACLYAGVVAVPAYPPDPERLTRTLPRLQSIFRDCEAQVVLTTQAIAQMAPYFFEQAPDLATYHWLATDDTSAELASTYLEPRLSHETLAFLQYTSGSTGDPKGVMLTHGNLLHNLKLIRDNFEASENTVGASWLPPYHDMGLIGGILTPCYIGGSTVLLSPLAFLQKPFRWLKAISDYRGTHGGGPNFAFELCARKITDEQKAKLDLKSWQLAFCGAEPIRAKTLQRFTEAFAECGFSRKTFYPCYGLAEGTLMVTGGRLPERDEISSSGAFSCGKSFAGQELWVVDPNSGKACEDKTVGEIWVRGPSIAKGYWNKSELSREIFGNRLETSGTNETFLRTGDLGFLDQASLFVVGRLKDLIILAGQNYYPTDIESTVETSDPSVRPGCVAAFSVDIEDEEKLIVVAEIESQKAGDLGEVIRRIRQSVAELHEVQVFSVSLLRKGMIPKTSSGKLQRFACRQAFLDRSLECLAMEEWPASRPNLRAMPGGRPNVAVSGKNTEAIRQWLIQQLSDRLGMGTGEIEPDKPFTSYGLDSKEAVNLCGELEDYLGRSFAPTLLWKYPSVDALSQFLSGDSVLESQEA